MVKKKPRNKLPKELAVINADNCTGCESCLEVCPVDCIEVRTIDRGVVKVKQTASVGRRRAAAAFVAGIGINQQFSEIQSTRR